MQFKVRVTSWKPRVGTLNPRVDTSNSRVTILIPRVVFKMQASQLKCDNTFSNKAYQVQNELFLLWG